MSASSPRSYRAGGAIEDYCRACKSDRMHTVVAADAAGHAIRVVCDYCRSEHNYRGGPRVDVEGAPVRVTPSSPREHQPSALVDPLPIVSERERTMTPMASETTADLELL